VIDCLRPLACFTPLQLTVSGCRALDGRARGRGLGRHGRRLGRARRAGEKVAHGGGGGGEHDDDDADDSGASDDDPSLLGHVQHQMQMPVPLPQGNGQVYGLSKSTFDIDQVTLECMMNKNLYKKYLAKTDMDKYQQSKVQSRRLASVRAPVLDITRQLIDDYVRYGNSKQYTHKIHSVFEAYIDLCMTYITEHPPGSENDDVDVMFDPRKMKSNS
jgi:hypothetical protein